MSNELEVPDLPDGVQSVSIKEQKTFDGLPFPLILSPSDDFKGKDSQFWNAWVKRNLKVIESLLLKYGAILFRGFPFDNENDFDEFSKAYGYSPFLDVGGTGVRNNVAGNVYTSNDTLPEFKIPFHHEMAHLSDYPLIVFFYCDIPAKEGGNTPLALSNVVYRKMIERDPEFVNRLEKEGLRYLRVASDGNNPNVSYGRSWQSTFFTNSKEEAEITAKNTGYDFEWLEDGGMKTITEVLPAIRVDKRTGKTMWFNSVFAYILISEYTGDYRNIGVFFPNGDCIGDESVDTLKQVMEEVKVSFKWQRRDVVLVDNRSVQHSKEAFSAPPRRLLVSQFKDYQGPVWKESKVGV